MVVEARIERNICDKDVIGEAIEYHSKQTEKPSEDKLSWLEAQKTIFENFDNADAQSLCWRSSINYYIPREDSAALSYLSDQVKSATTAGGAQRFRNLENKLIQANQLKYGNADTLVKAADRITDNKPHYAIALLHQAENVSNTVAGGDTSLEEIRKKLLVAYSNLVKWNLREGNSDEAVSSAKRLVDFVSSTFGDDSPYFLSANLFLARAYNKNLNPAAAKASYEMIINRIDALDTPSDSLQKLKQAAIREQRNISS